MVCPFDRAQALELRQREQAIKAQLARVRPTATTRFLPSVRRWVG
jgi:hypothetical protein